MTTEATATATANEATEAQAVLLACIKNHFLANGTGPTVRMLMEAIGSTSPNNVQEKVKILIRKKLVVADEYTDAAGRARYKAGSLKPANWQELRGITVEPVSRKEANSGFGENFAFVIMGEKIAFMFFNDSAKMSDVVDLTTAIKTADGLNIPAGTTVERLTALAAKMAPRKLRPTPAVVAPPAPVEPAPAAKAVKKSRTKKTA